MSEEIETGVSHIAYFRTDGGSPKLYTQEYVDDLQNKLQQKEKIINEFEHWLKTHLDEEFYWFKMYDKLQGLKEDSSKEVHK